MDAPGLGVQHTYHSAGREVRHKRMRNGRNMSADGLEIDACRCASIVKAGNTRKVIARAMSNYMRRTREYNNYNNYSLVVLHSTEDIPPLRIATFYHPVRRGQKACSRKRKVSPRA